MTNLTRVLLFLTALLAASCQQKPMRAYATELTSNDSMLIQMGQWELTRYHSDKLGMQIDYPSFLYRQELPNEPSQELFMAEDISLSVVVDSLNGMNYSAGQQMMGMGAELVDATERYSIQTGQDGDWEYYGKVIDDDTVRLVTVMLRYYPSHAEAVEALREWVRNFDIE